MDFLSDEEKNILRDLIKTEIETLNYYDRLSDLDISENAYNLEYMYLVNKIRTNHELVKELYNIDVSDDVAEAILIGRYAVRRIGATTSLAFGY